jgi:hypothetical protein
MQRLLIGFACLFFGICQTVPSLAQTRTNALDWSHSTAKGLVLTIKTERQNYRQGDEIHIDATLKNISDKPIELTTTEPSELGYEMSLCHTNGDPVKSPDATEGRIKTWRSIMFSTTQETLTPGDSITKTVDLGLWFNIEKDGIYDLRAAQYIFCWTSDYVLSGKVRIEVAK